MSEPLLIATLLRPEGDTGVQAHFRAMSAYLAEKGLPYAVVTPYEISRAWVYPVFALRRFLSRVNGAAGVWWYRHWHETFLQLALKRRLAHGEPCIIYAQCPLSARAALAARVSTSQRVVLVVHFNVSQADEWADKGDITRTGRVYRAILATETDVLPQLDGVVFVSTFMHDQLVGRIPAMAEVPSIIAPNFLRDPGFSESSGYDGDLISIGTLEPRKNQSYQLELLAALREQGVFPRLTIVGDGPDRAMLERQVATLQLSQQVSFLGAVKCAANLVTRHRAYLHTACMESFGITLIESMSRSRPVFAVPVGGIPEVFNDGVEGRYLPANDVRSAAALIAEWLASPQKMGLAGGAGRERYLSHFTSEAVASRVHAFCLSIAPRKQAMPR